MPIAKVMVSWQTTTGREFENDHRRVLAVDAPVTRETLAGIILRFEVSSPWRF
jgi:hypothetical protein